MQPYIASHWQSIFASQNLQSFADFWQVSAEMVEAGNERRGGWSHVHRLQFTDPHGQHKCIYIKRQQNHRCRTWFAPIKGVATLAREFKRIMQLKNKNIPTLEPLYFCEEGDRAILITNNLENYIPLDEVTRLLQERPLPFKEKMHMLQTLAKSLRRFHDHSFRHNTLYPKHIFMRIESSGEYCKNPDFVLIDLETTKRSFSHVRALVKDLRKLHRYSPLWSRTAKLRFLKYYRGEEKLKLRDRLLLRYFD